MITPIEIKQHQFKKGFNGYNKDDVHNFLNTLSVEWERVLEDLKRTKQDLDKTSTALDGLRQVESALHRTLLQAEETSRATIEGAKKDADTKISVAEARANEIVTKALGERDRIEKQIKDLIARRTEILGQLRNYLTAQTDRLTSFEEKEMKRYVAPVRPPDPVPVAQSKPAEKAPAQVEAKKSVAAAEVPTAEKAVAAEKTAAETAEKSSAAAELPAKEAPAAESKPAVKDVPSKGAEKPKDPTKRSEVPKVVQKPAEKKATEAAAPANKEAAKTAAPAAKEASSAAKSSSAPKVEVKPKQEAAKEESASTSKEPADPKRPIISVRPVPKPKPKEEAKPVGNEEKKSFFDRNVGSDSGDDSMIDDLLDEL